MRTEFMLALRRVAMERNLPLEVVIRDLEAALSAAFRKESSLALYQDLKVKVHPVSGEIHVFVPKLVVDEVTDSVREISFEEARRIKPEVKEGEEVEVELSKEIGRVSVQLAKQTLIQRLRKTEEITVFEEFQKYESEIVSGTIQKKEGKQIWVDLERVSGCLLEEEQIPGERYQIGQRMRFYVLKVCPSSNKGFQILLSRKHKNFLTRLFHLEVPEVYQGKVEIKAVAREAGSRSKVAVFAKENIDPVGSCVGPRGIRIGNIVRELNGENVDVILWEEDPAKFIANALSPAHVREVKLLPEENTAVVIIPDEQFSLAIGKGGQNARLAAKLTGWRINIKPLSLFKPEAKPVEEQAEEIVEVKLAPAEEKAEVIEAKTEVKPPSEAAPAKAIPAKKHLTIEELLTSISITSQKKTGLKFVEEPKPEKEKKAKKGPKLRRPAEEEEDYY